MIERCVKKIKDATHKNGDFNGTCEQGFRLLCDLDWCVDDNVLKICFQKSYHNCKKKTT